MNSRSLQRRLSSGPSPITSQRLSLLRQQDSTRVPLLARSGAAFDNRLSPMQGDRPRGRLTRTSAFRGGSNWLGSGVASQQREFELNRQRLMNTASASERQRDVSNAILRAQNLARLSPTAASSHATTARWRDIPSGNGRFSQGRNSGGEFSVSGASQWRKPVGAASFRGQNIPVTLDVERVSGPLPLAGFNGPEFGAGGPRSERGKASTGGADGSTDTLNAEGGPTGQSGRILEPSAQNVVNSDPSLPLLPAGNEPVKKEPWPAQPSNFPPPQEVSVQQLQASGDPSYLAYDVSALGSNTNGQQGFEPLAPPVPPVPPPGGSEPTLWESFMNGAGSTAARLPEVPYNNGADMGIQRRDKNNNEPFMGALSLTGSPPPVPLDQVGLPASPPQGMSGTNTQYVDNKIDSNGGGFNTPQYDMRSQAYQQQHQQNYHHQQQQQQQSQLKLFQRQQQQPQQTLFQRLNRIPAFTDPGSHAVPTTLVEDSNSALPKDELGSDSNATSPRVPLDSLQDPAPPDVTDTLPTMPLTNEYRDAGEGSLRALVRTEAEVSDMQETPRWPTFSTSSQRHLPASVTRENIANQLLGLTNEFIARASATASSRDHTQDRSNVSNNMGSTSSGSSNNSPDLLRSLSNLERQLSREQRGRPPLTAFFTLPSV